MKNAFLILSMFLILTCVSFADTNGHIIASDLSSIPLSFTLNQGQFGEKTQFIANSGMATFYFCNNEVAYLFTRNTDELLEDEAQTSFDITDKFDKPRFKKESMLIKASFIGANLNPEVIGVNRLSHNNNYFYGNDQSAWRTDVPNYSAIIYKNIYQGIDLKYYGDGKSMKYDFIVQPGADISLIKIRYDGVDDLSVTNTGDLQIQTRFNNIHEKIPYIYQEISGKKKEIAGCYNVIDPGVFGFDVDSYNSDIPLIIDPELVYSTYLGGSTTDEGHDIAVDNSGNAYVTGFTDSNDFPTVNPYNGSFSGGWDICVSKLSPEGNSLIYSTFIGGDQSDHGYAIAIDGSGNAYITGYSNSTDFPTVGPYDESYNGGGGDAIAIKLSPAGNSLTYSTYLGGSDNDRAWGIAVDGSGSAYITGYTESNDFPTANPYDGSFNGGYTDVFVTKFSPAGNSLAYSTYLGGTADDQTWDLAIDGSGSAYVTGYTSSLDFPMANPYDNIYDYGNDAFVTKFSPAGNSLIYSTYLGDSSSDFGKGIAVDDVGCAYVIGHTYSDNFPMVNPYDASYNGGGDAFVTKFSTAGGSLLYSTFLGGNDWDNALSIAVDANGCAYAAGETVSLDFPMVYAYDWSYNGNIDVFVTKLASAGNSLVYSTYLGGSDRDDNFGITVDGPGSAYVIGRTNSLNYPVENPFQIRNNGGWDACITKLGRGVIGYEYLPGDANMPNGIWPPSVIGADVTYLVNYFRSLSGPCLLDGFYASADANGDCMVIGSDVTRLVNYFRGLTGISWCSDWPTAWPPVPEDAPPGWPNCE